MDTPTTYTDIFAVGNVLDPHIAIQGQCRACQGSGTGPAWFVCRKCHKQFFPDMRDTGDFTLEQVQDGIETKTRPCGHGWKDWDEGCRCLHCKGTGQASVLVRLSELLTAPGPALEYIKTEEETNE